MVKPNIGNTCFDSLQSADFNPTNLQDIYKQTIKIHCSQGVTGHR